MKANTRLFGEIDIEESKIVKMESGIVGFPELKNFTLLFDEEKKDDKCIMWFQSMDEPVFAMPVMLPQYVKADYNPTINDSLLAPLGALTPENTYVLVTVTVPTDIKKMTVNLKAPIIINTDTCKGAQLIVEDDVPVKYPVYDILKAAKEKGGE